MSTQWVNSESEQHWQQPSFSGPTVSGEVLSPGQRPRPVVIGPGDEELRWRMLRRWLFPLGLVLAVITGAWWQTIIAVIVISALLRRRINELRYQRLVASDHFGTDRSVGPTDLR